MEQLLNIGYGLIEGVDNVFSFLTTTYEISILGITLFKITPIGILSITGLIFIFSYYLVRSMGV